MTVTLIVVKALGTAPEGLKKETRGIRDQKKHQDHTDHRIVKIDLNNQMSPGDLRRLAATLTSVKNHQLTLV